MALLLDVLEVLGGGAIHGVVLAHVAQPARVLGETLAIARLTAPLHREMFRFEELRAGDQGDAGRTEDFHRC